MTLEERLKSMKRSICANVDFDELGSGEYLIHTGFTYSDGDELHIVMKSDDDGYTLSDEGHTLMWLSYEDFNMTDTRKRLFDKIIQQNNVEFDNGCITVSFSNESQAGQSLYSLAQAILQIADLRYMDRSNVASTFLEDMKAEIMKTSLASYCVVGKKIQLQRDEICEPDIYIDVKNPILVFGVSNSDRAKRTIIDLMNLKENNYADCRIVVVIDDSVNITKNERKMLINRADKPVYGTADLSNIIIRFEEVSA